MTKSIGTRNALGRPRPRGGPLRTQGKPRPAAPDIGLPGRSGRASKVSITVDSEVLQEVKRLLRATGSSLSAHVTEALERDLRRRRLQEIIEEYEAENGVIGEDELAEIRAAWQV